MTITWPTTLPLPTVEGYGIRPGEAILRTETEAEPARQRKRFTQVPTRIAVRWLMRREQFALFEAWFRVGALGLAPGDSFWVKAGFRHYSGVAELAFRVV